MSHSTFRIPKPVKEVLDDLGIETSVIQGSRHFRLMAEGQQLAVFGKGGKQQRGDHRRVICDIRRWARAHGQAK